MCALKKLTNNRHGSRRESVYKQTTNMELGESVYKQINNRHGTQRENVYMCTNTTKEQAWNHLLGHSLDESVGLEFLFVLPSLDEGEEEPTEAEVGSRVPQEQHQHLMGGVKLGQYRMEHSAGSTGRDKATHTTNTNISEVCKVLSGGLFSSPIRLFQRENKQFDVLKICSHVLYMHTRA